MLINSASEHANSSSLASANKTVWFIGSLRTGVGGNRPPTKPFCLHLNVFQLAQLSRETSLRLSVPTAFLKSFSLPPWWALSSVGCCTSKQRYNLSLCMLLLKEMLSWGWCLNRTEGVGGSGAPEDAFLPATWHGGVGSCLMRKGFPNTAVPVFIAALVLLLWWSSFLICFLKYRNYQTVAQAVEATLWLQPFLLAACFPIVSNTALSLWNVLAPSDNAGYCVAEEWCKPSVKQKKNPLHRSW